mgnify:CR=1 FL=1
MSLDEQIPRPWHELLAPALDRPWFAALQAFVAAEREQHEVYPPAPQVFRALALTPPDRVRVVLLGQDPYHGPGQANGLCFSVNPGVKLPPSLRNILRERYDDLGMAMPDHGDLEHWARQGVLLLNTVLTVRAHEANSHRDQGWEQFTDAVVRAVARARDHLVALLWGRSAAAKRHLFDPDRHHMLEAPHPSPLSAHRGFFGSRPFSRANAILEDHGEPAIDWALPADVGPQPMLPL